MVTHETTTLRRLRHTMAAIEGSHLRAMPGIKPAAGSDAIGAILGGCLNSSALHEFSPVLSSHLGAATGFVLALAARVSARKQVLWIRPQFADGEAGLLYGHGVALLGLPLDRVLTLRVARSIDALWAMEEALKCRAVACVIAELPDNGGIADLTATRRLSLAARRGGGFGFLFRHRASSFSSSAETRWEVAAAPSSPDRFGGLGRIAFALSLTKNRRGPTGHGTVTWNHHDRSFSALSLDMAAPALGRSGLAPLSRAG